MKASNDILKIWLKNKPLEKDLKNFLSYFSLQSSPEILISKANIKHIIILVKYSKTTKVSVCNPLNAFLSLKPRYYHYELTYEGNYQLSS